MAVYQNGGLPKISKKYQFKIVQVYAATADHNGEEMENLDS